MSILDPPGGKACGSPQTLDRYARWKRERLTSLMPAGCGCTTWEVPLDGRRPGRCRRCGSGAEWAVVDEGFAAG